MYKLTCANVFPYGKQSFTSLSLKWLHAEFCKIKKKIKKEA